MIAILKHGTTPSQTSHLVSWLKTMNLDVHISQGKEVTILGAATRAEIWDSSRWNAYNEEQTQENLLSAMELLEI